MTERVKRTQSRTVVTVISRISERPVAKEACLVVIYGMDLGKKFNLDTATVNIGRSSKCDIQVDQESVSRNHARIINTGKSLILRDLGSTNGTFVQGARFSFAYMMLDDAPEEQATLARYREVLEGLRAHEDELWKLLTA